MPAKQFIIVVNPSGGRRRGLSVLAQVKPVFAKAGAGLQVHVTRHAGHAAELAKTLDLDPCDGFCVIGGDGTLHETVHGLMSRKMPPTVPLGMIPGGSGNSFLHHFGCLDPIQAARRIVVGHPTTLDVARVSMGAEVTYSVNVIGWGAVVDINRTAEKLRRLGSSRYTVAALSHILRARRRHATLALDGEVLEGHFLFIAVCNTQFTGRAMRLAPAANCADGKLDVVWVRDTTRYQRVELFRKVFDGSHVLLPWVECRQVRSCRITRGGVADLLNLDGELKGSTPVSIEMMPSALKVFV